MTPGIIPAESPEEHARNCLALLSLARYGETSTGQPARLLTREEHDAITRRLRRVVEQLETASRERLLAKVGT